MSTNWKPISFRRAWIIRENISPYPNQATPSSTTQDYRQMGNMLLMVATLIATVTFAAAFTMPGGFNNNIGPQQGFALLQSSLLFRWFIVSDTIAMTCSITAVCIIFWGSIFGGELYVYYFGSAMALTYIALQSTGATFMSGITAAMPDDGSVLLLNRLAGSLFHVTTCLALFQFAKMFSVHEACQFFVYRMTKRNSCQP